MPQMRETKKQNLELWKGGNTYVVQPTSTELAASQEASGMASETTDQRNGHRVATRTVGKQKKFPVRDGLRHRPEGKPIVTNLTKQGRFHMTNNY